MAGARSPLVVLVLAAGKGTRLRSKTIKLLHQVAGRPMVTRLLDAVQAKIAFVRGLTGWVDITHAIGTGLNTVAAAHTIGIVDQHDAVASGIGGADRTDLNAGRVGALVAQLRDKKASQGVYLFIYLRETIYPTVRTVDNSF